MIRTLLKVAGVAVVAIVLVGVTLYMFGVRVLLDGGGSPRLGFAQSDDARADLIAKHREAQKAGPPPAPAPPAAPAPVDTGAPPHTTSGVSAGRQRPKASRNRHAVLD